VLPEPDTGPEAEPDAGAARAALAGALDVPFWLDTPDRPPARPGPDRDRVVDLAIVGGGLTGVWAALLAAQTHPDARTVLLEGARLGWAASGRNGGFCSASLTHGLGNGVARWPTEMPTLLALGRDNLEAIEQTAARIAEETGFDCGFERTGELAVATAPWQAEGLAEEHRHAVDLGMDVELLDAAGTRALVDSPTYEGGLLDRTGCALVDPARLVWGVAALAERAGVGLYEHRGYGRRWRAQRRPDAAGAPGPAGNERVPLADAADPALRRAGLGPRAGHPAAGRRPAGGDRVGRSTGALRCRKPVPLLPDDPGPADPVGWV
jgi:glycine/D-amino acid oxidase-like deaminating enzyme